MQSSNFVDENTTTNKSKIEDENTTSNKIKLEDENMTTNKIKLEDENKTSSRENPKSAFVSNALDEFLNEHSKLNISYEVPKLEAEQGITQNFTDTSLPEVSEAKPENEPEALLIPKREEVYKPKTLAEKRKLLQKRNSVYGKSMNNDTKKPALDFTKDAEIKSEQKINYCIIHYDYKKFRVPVKSSRTIPFYIKNTENKKRNTRAYVYVPYKKDLKKYMKRKPSLLTSLGQNRSSKVHYKPGPMCMKKNLQDSCSVKEWKTIVKQLPKITLQVTPNYRKSFDPKIHHLLDFKDATISKERLEFALAAVKTNDSNEKKCLNFLLLTLTAKNLS